MPNVPSPPPGAKASASPGALAEAPRPDDQHEDQHALLRDEFSGWTITVPFTATRPGDGSGAPTELTAGSYGELRALLDEADAVDCTRAIGALVAELQSRDLTARSYGLSMHTQTRAGIVRGVSARRARFAWVSGVDLGPITDITAAADRMMPALGHRPRP